MSYVWASFLIGMIAGVGLVIAVVGMWNFWSERPSRVRPEIASEAARWLQGQDGSGTGNTDWRDP